MPTMKYGLARHRGACSISETAIPRRKFSRVRRDTSPAAMDRARVAEHEAKTVAESLAFKAFELACDMVKYRNNPTIEMLIEIYSKCHPRAKLETP